MTHLPIEAVLLKVGDVNDSLRDRFKDVCLASDEQVSHLQRVTKNYLVKLLILPFR